MADDMAPEILSYARPDAAPRSRAARVPVLLAAPLVVLFYAGLAPSVGSFAFDYTRAIPLHEALTGVVRVSPVEVLRDEHTRRAVGFVPCAAVVLTAFWIARRRAVRAGFALVATLLPLMFVPLSIAGYLPLIAPDAVEAVLGRSDGEEWSEGEVAYGTLGLWIILWAATLLTISASALKRIYRG